MLTLDVGNSHIFGGYFEADKLQFSFRYPSTTPVTSDQFGLFLKGILREHNQDPKAVTDIAISSVVPSLDYSITAACIKYFGITPLALKPGVKTGLQLKINNPIEIGADRVANAVAAMNLFSQKDIIIIDFGTATTVCALSSKKEYLGGTIMPGIKMAMESLHTQTARLAPVDILKPTEVIGKTTETNIQSGLYYSQLGGIERIIQHIRNTTFKNQDTTIVATGGYAHLFESEGLYDVLVSDLVLHGLRIICELNNHQKVTSESNHRHIY
jgi:type III pantothenate kinase